MKEGTDWFSFGVGLIMGVLLGCIIVLAPTSYHPLVASNDMLIVGKVIRAEENSYGQDWYVVKLNDSAVQYLDDRYSGIGFFRFHVGDTLKLWNWDGKEYREAVLVDVNETGVC